MLSIRWENPPRFKALAGVWGRLSRKSPSSYLSSPEPSRAAEGNAPVDLTVLAVIGSEGQNAVANLTLGRDKSLRDIDEDLVSVAANDLGAAGERQAVLVPAHIGELSSTLSKMAACRRYLRSAGKTANCTNCGLVCLKLERQIAVIDTEQLLMPEIKYKVLALLYVQLTRQIDSKAI